MLKFIKKYWDKLRTPIYRGERLQRHLDISALIGLILAGVCTITSVMNIIQNRGFVTYTTIAMVIAGFFIAFAAKVLRNLRAATLTAFLICTFILTYYVVCGTNEGFACLWTMLVPLAFSYFCGVLYGIAISMYYEILFIVVFYSPIRAYVEEYYTDVFMDRFPVLYLCGILLTSVAMINYHVSVLAQEEYERKLTETVRTAVAAEKAKSRFLAQMSHEIRTPINAVLGMNEMILRSSEDPEILEYADNIQSSGRTLLALINSILDFSKIEDGKMEIIPVTYDTASFIHNIVNSISARAEGKGLELITDIDHELPSQLEGDDMRVSQIIMNLLTNAVKYTEKGSVTLTVKKIAVKNGDLTMGVSVRDTGMGIKKEDMGRLFESFERLDELKNRNIEGTGLGMSIVTGLLDMMGSKLNVESEYGKGSVFSFELPQKVISAEPLGDYSERIARSERSRSSDIDIYAPNASVLVVDDNEMNLKVAKNLLKLCGINPDLAASGSQAIDMMHGKKYHIVFLDHMMPVMDGVETLRKLKTQDMIPQGTTVIALTANAIAGAKEKYLAAGFHDYLSKPIEIPQLEKKLRLYLPAELIKVPEKKPAAPHNETLAFLSDTDGEEEAAPGGTGDRVFDKLRAAGISPEDGLMYCADDRDFYTDMLGEFAASAKEKSEKIEALHKSGDLKEYCVLVHALKSTSKTIGAAELSEKARALETAAKAGDTDFIKKEHAPLMAMYAKTASEISAALSQH